MPFFGIIASNKSFGRHSRFILKVPGIICRVTDETSMRICYSGEYEAVMTMKMMIMMMMMGRGRGGGRKVKEGWPVERKQR